MSIFTDLASMAAAAQPHHGITLTNGTYIEGYILDYADDWIEFGAGGPLAEYDQTTRYSRHEIQLIWFMNDGTYQSHHV